MLINYKYLLGLYTMEEIPQDGTVGANQIEEVCKKSAYVS